MSVKMMGSPDAAKLLGITYRQLDYWSGLLGWNTTGTGHYRMFNTGQMVTLANLTALVGAGMPPTRAIKHVGRDRIVVGDCTITVDLVGINRRMARAVAGAK